MVVEGVLQREDDLAPAVAVAPSDADDLRSRLLDVALTRVERAGIAKTSVADLAAAAGCSRATVYRAFPGGRPEVFQALGRRELVRFFADVFAAIERAETSEDALTNALTAASTGLRDHVALQRLLAEEPGVLLPYLGFTQLGRVLAAAVVAGAPHLAPFVAPGKAAWAGEWLTRIVLQYLFNPDPAVDLTRDADARRLVRAFLLPSLAPSAA